MTAYRPSRRSTLRLLGAAPLAATGVLATSGTAQAAGDNRVPAALKPGGSVDEFVAALAAEDKFAGTVLLVHRDRPVLVRSYGLADKERSIPNRLDTIYALGSITKMFTAVAVMQLVQQGTIGLHERLGTYLDGFPQQIADTVTIHQLLTHTSGLGDYLHSDAFWQ
jgi:CubicO group peptidase (beta-lactamase class C family)